jgi:hypothetical protein
MNRYSGIPVIQSPKDPRRRYANTKYPEITVEFSDIYVYITQGDRYDLLARDYYQDSSFWWIISRANPSQPSDSLSPTPGSQIRIPSADRISGILNRYNALNSNI